MDTYRNFAALKNAQRENEDFHVRVLAREGAPVVVIAPHGGAIEPGTSEIAEAVAGNDFGLAIFAGTKDSGNSILHITSTNFDEPRCVALVQESQKVVAIHGEDSAAAIVFLGGKDVLTGAQVRAALERAGYAVQEHDNPELQGTADRNICNRSKRGAGVQLELSRGLRATFFEALNAAGRKRPKPELMRFAQTVREGLTSAPSDCVGPCTI